MNIAKADKHHRHPRYSPLNFENGTGIKLVIIIYRHCLSNNFSEIKPDFRFTFVCIELTLLMLKLI